MNNITVVVNTQAQQAYVQAFGYTAELFTFFWMATNTQTTARCFQLQYSCELELLPAFLINAIECGFLPEIECLGNLDSGKQARILEFKPRPYPEVPRRQDIFA